MNDIQTFKCAVFGPDRLEGRRRVRGTLLFQSVEFAKSAADATAMIEASAMNAGVSLNFEGCTTSVVDQ
jgi:hypothetical protein